MGLNIDDLTKGADYEKVEITPIRKVCHLLY